jgi:hypothetical protein
MITMLVNVVRSSHAQRRRKIKAISNVKNTAAATGSL